MALGTVMLVSNTAWSLYKFRLKVIESFIKAGYRVVLLAADDEFGVKLNEIGAEFYSLKNMEGKGKNVFKEAKLIAEIAGWYKKIDPLLIFQYTIKPNIYGTFIARYYKLRCISIVTGLGYTFINKGITSSLAKVLYRCSLKGATEVWFLNNDDKNLFLLYNLVDARKAVILPGEGIDCEAFNPDAIHAPPRNNSRISFILIARLLYDKGVREYVGAAKIIRTKYENVDFNLMGYLNVQNPSAISPEEINEWVRKKYVNYLGSKSDVRETILMHDCVILPSYREGMSMVLLESAALARPLIATDIPGCKELIDHGITGFTCKVKSAEDLAAKIEQFINLTAEERNMMGNNGRKKMLKEFDVQNIIEQYFKIVQKYKSF